jgi:dGTPase
MIGYMVADVLAETRERLAAANPQSADDIRNLDHAVVDFSESFRSKEKPLRAFLFENMYKHFKVNRMMSTAGRVVRELFELFIVEPQLLPKHLYQQTNGPQTFETARVVCDYIASMTDSFAIAEHKKLYKPAGYF